MTAGGGFPKHPDSGRGGRGIGSGRRAGVAAVLALATITAPGASAPPGDVVVAPQLIITSGGGTKAKTPAQLEKSVAKGDPAACYELGVRLMDGAGVTPDLPRARSLFEQAAKGGVANAFFRLGKIYADGRGVPADFARSFRNYSEAAVRGVPEAQHNVGAMLVSARGVKRDYVEGLAWIILAGKSGAESDAETQVRAHLARRPGEIAAAEARAAELEKSLREAKPVMPRATILSPAGSPVEAPKFEPERAGPAKVEVTPPKIEVPVESPPPASPGKP